MNWSNFTGGGNNFFYQNIFEEFVRAQPEPEPDLIECMVTGPAGGQFKTYLRPEELEELQGRYEGVQRNRAEAEYERKKREYQAQANRDRIQENMEDFIKNMGGFRFAGTDDGYRSTPPRPEPKTVPPSELSDARWRELCELAGAPVKTALTQKQLYRRAMRKCHPDTGGSHELWIRLDKLKQYLSL